MEPIWINFVSVLTIFTLAIVSPGPNFILVTKTSLTDSRRAGLYTALGVATGSGLFALAGLTGLLLIISTLPHFAITLRFLGGGYLAWLGIDMLIHCRRSIVTRMATSPISATRLSPARAYRTGLLTNLTNPKAWAFYLSLFSLVVQPGTPATAKVALNVAMFFISLGWYTIVVLLISDSRIQPGFVRLQPVIQSCLGLLLIGLAIRLLLS